MEAIGFRDVSAFLTGIKRNLYHLFCLPGIVLCGKITILVQVLPVAYLHIYNSHNDYKLYRIYDGKRGTIMFGILWTIIIGAVCGYIAGKVMNVGAGLLVNIILGIAGGCVGGFLFRILGFAATSLVGTIISGVVGSVLLIYIGKNFFK